MKKNRFVKFLSSLLFLAICFVSTNSVLAATNAIATPVALFETSLASKITATQTTMTLVSAATKDGTTLVSSTYEFIIDEGTASEEFVIADCVATACTSVQRGLSVLTGTTTVVALEKEHRRGASVKITDGPLLLKLTRILNGIATIPNTISYTTHPTFTATTQIVDKKYVDDTAFSGASVIDATSAARGVVELATGAEAAASTAAGSSGTLALPASLATSTFNSATAANRVVVTGGTGKIDNFFIATSTLGTNLTLSGTTTVSATSSLTVGAFSAWEIGKQSFISTTTGTSTFSVPSGITRVQVEVIGAGGGSEAVSTGAGAYGGGGAGARCVKTVNLTGTSTVQYFVGTAGAAGASGTWSTFGTNGFYCSAGGGTGNTGGSKGGAAGGNALGGDINVSGAPGTGGATSDTGGTGGSTLYGAGGQGSVCNANGSTGQGMGAGGGGGCSSGSHDGAAGTNGGIIIRW